MSTDPRAYRDLNQHHAEIEGQAPQVAVRHSQGTEQEAATHEQQQRSERFAAYLDSIRDQYGDDFRMTPEHEAAARKTLGKDLSPEYVRQELADITKAHVNIEHDRQFRSQQEADQAREVEKAEDKQAEVQPQSGYQSFIAESEQGKSAKEREHEVRHAEFVARLAEKSSAQREREHGGNEL